MRSPRLVKPVTSQNRTVTVLRTSGSATWAMRLESKTASRKSPKREATYTVRRLFDQLSERLQGALGDLRKRGKLDDEAVSRAMREIRLALLEADVNFQIVKQFVESVARAGGRRGGARRA